MERMSITAPSQSHLLPVLRGLLRSGWTIVSAPKNGRLARNGQRLILQTPRQDARVRLFVYKVTQSSRGKVYERRIEITSTYKNGRIARLHQYTDAVLGFDPDHDIYVGV